MKCGLFIVLFAFLAGAALAQESEPQGDFGEVFGLARSHSATRDCEKPEPLPDTRAEWEAVVAKIESGQINRATVDAFISGEMPKDLHTEELGRQYHKAHYAYVRAKIENPSTGCEFTEYTIVGSAQNLNELLNRTADQDSVPSQEDLNMIWAAMLGEIERQQQKTSKPKAD